MIKEIKGYVIGIIKDYKIPWYARLSSWLGGLSSIDLEMYKHLELTVKTMREEEKIKARGEELKIRLYANHNEYLENLKKDFERGAFLKMKGIFSEEPYFFGLGKDKRWAGVISAIKDKNLSGEYNFETRECCLREGETNLSWTGYKDNLFKSLSFS